MYFLQKKNNQEETYFTLSKSKDKKNLKKTILAQYAYVEEPEESEYNSEDYEDFPPERDLIDKILEQEMGEG